MSGIQLENLFKAVFFIAGFLAAVLQTVGFYCFRRVFSKLSGENTSAEFRKTCRSALFSQPRDEDFMAFLFTVACAYFGWIVLYKPYGFLPVLAVVLLTACLSGYGSLQRLQSGLRKIPSLAESHLNMLKKGRILFCCGIPLLVAAELCLILILVFTPEQLDQLVWLRQISKQP